MSRSAAATNANVDAAPDSAALLADLDLVGRFCDALWLEDGLSRNTIDAYRRDLTLLSRWLHANTPRALLAVDDAALNGYFAAST